MQTRLFIYYLYRALAFKKTVFRLQKIRLVELMSTKRDFFYFG
jgi:hypothetical protein